MRERKGRAEETRQVGIFRGFPLLHRLFSEAKNESKWIFMRVFFTFMAQKKGQTASWVIKSPRKRSQMPTKALSNTYVCLGAKMVMNTTHSVASFQVRHVGARRPGSIREERSEMYWMACEKMVLLARRRQGKWRCCYEGSVL